MLKDIQQQRQYKVLLIGDSCIDVYHYGRSDRTCSERRSPTSPAPVLLHERTESFPGMASNVNENLLSLDIQVEFVTNNETIRKERFVTSDGLDTLLRFDTHDFCKPVQEDSIVNLDLDIYDAIVISDYNKGFVNCIIPKYLRKNFTGPIFVDSKKTDLTCYEGCIIKINSFEFNRANIIPKNCDLIVTKGALGATWNGKTYPTFDVETIDVCGAGDSFLSGLVFMYLRTKSIDSSMRFANFCASKSLNKIGNKILSLQDIKDYESIDKKDSM